MAERHVGLNVKASQIMVIQHHGLSVAAKTFQKLRPRSARLGIRFVDGVKQFPRQVGRQPDGRLIIRREHSHHSPLRERQTLYNDLAVDDGSGGDANLRDPTLGGIEGDATPNVYIEPRRWVPSRS